MPRSILDSEDRKMSKADNISALLSRQSCGSSGKEAKQTNKYINKKIMRQKIIGAWGSNRAA